MHSTVHRFGHQFSGDFDRVIKTHKLISPRMMVFVAIIVACLGVSVVSYVGQKAVVVTAKAFKLRPELFKNPYGEIVAIREADNTVRTRYEEGFSERLRKIGERYDVVYVAANWSPSASKK